MAGMPVLLLTTTGRRSGKSRTTPLLFVRDDDAFVVVGSNGGSDYVPAWWLNLRSNPGAEVEIGRGRVPVDRAQGFLRRARSGSGPSSHRTTRAMRGTRPGWPGKSRS